MKRMGTAVYVHKTAIDQLKEDFQQAYLIAERVNLDGFEYDIIKWDYDRMMVTFISSPDWDTASEPLVGDAIRVCLTTGEVKKLRSRGQIYHHKHQFVNEDYTGFDIEESKNWSKLWTSVLPATREMNNRIGYRKHWNNIVKQYGLR